MIQIVEMNHEEKVKMYSKCTKAKLIEMLIECNIQLENATRLPTYGQGVDYVLREKG